MIAIEKGVPIPPSKHGTAHQVLGMEIGDSFLYPDASMAQARGICQKAHNQGFRFTIRKQNDSDGNFIGHRVWRVK